MTDLSAANTASASPFLYLTTTGHRTGRPHEIEIWYVEHEGRYYIQPAVAARMDAKYEWSDGLIVELTPRERIGG